MGRRSRDALPRNQDRTRPAAPDCGPESPAAGTGRARGRNAPAPQDGLQPRATVDVWIRVQPDGRVSGWKADAARGDRGVSECHPQVHQTTDDVVPSGWTDSVA